MTIDQEIALLKKEQKNGLPSRFPCRAIMVRTITQYCELLEKLRQIPDIEFVTSSILFSSSDVMPRYENLTKKEYEDRWLVLTGVSEYLRLFGKSEADSQYFSKLWKHQSSAANKGRIIIPLWGCEAQWHDSSLHLNNDLRQDEFYINCSDSGEDPVNLNIDVLSNAFEKYNQRFAAQDGQIMYGLQDWYDYWANPVISGRKQILMTARYRSVKPISGDISVKVIGDILTFIKDNMNGTDNLTQDICPTEAQACLFEYALAGKNLDEAVLLCLNAGIFDEIDMMSKWPVLSEGQKQLVLLWVKFHPNNGYLSHCVRKAVSPHELNGCILSEIFIVRNTHPEWVNESQQLISAMKLTRSDNYFRELDTIPDYNERLSYLSGRTAQERVYLLHMVGKWFARDETQVRQNAALKNIFPELSAYLDGAPYDDDLRRYMGLYKQYKLSNTLPDDEEIYFNKFQTDNYDKRYTILSRHIIDDTVIVWVDALGAEWLPLLLWELKKRIDGKVKDAVVVLANLPSETEFNNQWEQMDVPYEKLDKLDKLAHKGVVDEPDYYSCVEEQISFVSNNLSAKISSLLREYHRVIITGDHGTSRLAARFFHKRDGIPVDKGATVHSHGRYESIVSSSYKPTQTQTLVNDESGKSYSVFLNYDHYVQSGFAAGADDDNAIYGEIHGGGTPEEVLVPLIVFDSNEETSLKAKWQKNPVKIQMRKAKAIISFNKPIQSLEASIGKNQPEIVSLDKKTWSMTFANIIPGEYQVSINADGKLILIDPLTILPAMVNSDGDLP